MGGQVFQFVCEDNVNQVYIQVFFIVDLDNLFVLVIVVKVGSGYNCWSVSIVVCVIEMIWVIEVWIGSGNFDSMVIELCVLLYYEIMVIK